MSEASVSRPRPGMRNLGLFLAALPFNVLICGYAFLDVGMNEWAAAVGGGGRVEPPVEDLLVCAGLTVALGVLLWLGKGRVAALLQVLPLLFVVMLIGGWQPS
ncbi:hypothetical protein AB0A69_01750 [Streptomyces sp. NPDC045431]|uniref:hypothetical protein n=1 Tax=Streptomyces sp. NPDC045431 TaxID=3155613 RepID=UPI0033E5847C